MALIEPGVLPPAPPIGIVRGEENPVRPHSQPAIFKAGNKTKVVSPKEEALFFNTSKGNSILLDSKVQTEGAKTGQNVNVKRTDNVLWIIGILGALLFINQQT